MRSPSLYNHIDGLGALRHELRLLAIHSATEAMREATARRHGDDALAALCRALRAHAAAHPGLYAAPQPSVHTPDTDPALRAAGDEQLDVVRAALVGYGLDGDDALHAIRALRSAVHGFISLERAGAFGMPIAIDESFERLIRLLADGFSSSG